MKRSNKLHEAKAIVKQCQYSLTKGLIGLKFGTQSVLLVVAVPVQLALVGAELQYDLEYQIERVEDL